MTPLADRVTEIVVEDLEVVYQRGAEPAVSGVDVTLRAGQSLLVTGGHGSGKSSFLRAILGLVVATGHIEVLGSYAGDPRNAPRIGYAPQGRSFCETHSPRHLVTTIVVLRAGRRDDGAVHDALVRAGIPPDRHDARDLGVEEQRRLALACALVGTPDVLVLDDPWEFTETITAVERTLAAGGIVIAASHEPGGLPEFFGSELVLTGVEPETETPADDETAAVEDDAPADTESAPQDGEPGTAGEAHG